MRNKVAAILLVAFVVLACLAGVASATDNLFITPSNVYPGANSNFTVYDKLTTDRQIAAFTIMVEHSSDLDFVSATKGASVPSGWSIDVFEDLTGHPNTAWIQCIGSGINNDYITGSNLVLLNLVFSAGCGDGYQEIWNTRQSNDCGVSFFCYLSTYQLETILPENLEQYCMTGIFTLDEGDDIGVWTASCPCPPCGCECEVDKSRGAYTLPVPPKEVVSVQPSVWGIVKELYKP